MSLKKLTLLIVSTVFALTACSDFFNSDNKSTPAPQGPTTFTGDSSKTNPFPEAFVEPSARPFSEEALLLNSGLNVIAPSVESFHQELQIFALRLQQSCRASALTEANLHENLTAQWEKVIYNLHKVDALAIGPMSDLQPENNLNPKSQLYSWPITNLCQVDKAVHDISFKGSIQTQLPYNSKGLDAIEYLLFATTDEVKCNLRANPQLRDWLALSPSTKAKNRCDVAQQLMTDLVAVTQNLQDKWDRQKGNFSKTLIDNTRFSNYKTAVNELTNALYSLETVKDMRLGIPLGKNKKECPSDKCPERIEHPFSKKAFISMQARLQAFKEGFFGGDIDSPNAHGIDDYLKQAGYPQVAEKMKAYVLQAETTLKNISQKSDLETLVLQMDPQLCKTSTSDVRHEELCSVYEDIRSITATMKTEVLVALSLNAPPIYQGDND